ncbi:c-type cytochrome [Robbsia sp. Bb-Pol-6]|uniref:C-type cytochrome n=1 Tax=Robbsia betulipollinis TaxID=2981849 RepID=A0ABT3ZM86_9BURK|nr:c-type cytochrome [Robbsia betulipollinis]MCY0387390.1 c-type cytochrome [Robbsia betulipollinis]
MELRVSPRRIFRPLLALLLFSSANILSGAHAQTPAPDTMAARMMGCAACHGAKGEGNGAYFPRLAGQPPDYLFHQLQAFRGEHRKYPAMNYLTSYLTDDYLHEIAAYFSAQKPVVPAGKPATAVATAAVLERGRTLATLGDAARGIPACASCHTASFTGRLPGIPGIIGLPHDYLSAQLGAFRTGVRHAIAPDCMQQVALKLSDTDIGAVSAWLSAQPVPRDLSPAPASAEALPLACGSQTDGQTDGQAAARPAAQARPR